MEQVLVKENTDPSGMELFDSDQRQKMIDEKKNRRYRRA